MHPQQVVSRPKRSLYWTTAVYEVSCMPNYGMLHSVHAKARRIGDAKWRNADEHVWTCQKRWPPHTPWTMHAAARSAPACVQMQHLPRHPPQTLPSPSLRHHQARAAAQKLPLAPARAWLPAASALAPSATADSRMPPRCTGQRVQAPRSVPG